MKRIGNIYPKVADRKNAQLAILMASKGKKEREDVKRVINNLEHYTDLLTEILKNKKYVPNPYNEMRIYDGSNKKERIIYKPRFFPDQCIHWALMLQLKPILKRGMYEYCCASVEGRGIYYGAKYVKKILVRDRKNTKYCLKLDIKKYYPSINKEILKRKFMRIIKDTDTLNLINVIIDSHELGLPIR